MIGIAILGLGTVGTGVAKLIEENQKSIQHKLMSGLEVKKILVRHFKESPYRSKMTDDFCEIENDKDIRVVVESIGGVGAAYEYTKRALLAGKHVVTANKQLVAEKGCELLALARKKKVSYLFEASVGGGIPVLHPLTQCMAANRIDEIYGILNGTTNYILTSMVEEGTSFTDALKEAQKRGYAEADPTADIEGIDAGRKICILANLAFGHEVKPQNVPMDGISNISLEDVKVAEQAGYQIRLLGRAVRLDNEKRTAYVAPHLISQKNPIANVSDVFNAILVRGNATGEVMFYGRGAGAMPTASACVSDVMEVLQENPLRPEIGWTEDDGNFMDPVGLKSHYYIRAKNSLSEIQDCLGQVKVLAQGEEQAFITELITGTEIKMVSKHLNVITCLRVLD